MLSFGSLFAGFGGCDLGLERAGMVCEWQVEIDEYAQQVLKKHWLNVRRWGDVRTFQPDGDWRVDVIIGGDPCQANTAAGKSTQQSLGGEFLRVVDALRPRVVVRENPSLIRKDAPWPWWRFRSGLESLGYAVLPFRLRACCLGAEHRRERLFLLATIPDANSDGLEGRPRQPPQMETVEPPRLLEIHDWPAIPADPGFDSRAGITGYVDEVRGLGNCVCPQISEWIGKRIIEATNPFLKGET
jgi:DNA (cytosine-5)-methyltransferase 1